MKSDVLDIPRKRRYDLSEVEFLDYVKMHSQDDGGGRFSPEDVARLGEMAGAAPKLADDGKGGHGYRTMRYIDIKPLLEAIEAKRMKEAA